MRAITTVAPKTEDLLTIKIIKGNGINSARAFVMFIQALEKNMLQNLEFKTDKTLELRLTEFEKKQKIGLLYDLQSMMKPLENAV